MSDEPDNPGKSKRPFRFQELGLVLVILGLGALLTVFGGNVQVPKMQMNEFGELERTFTEDAEGNRQLVLETKNKFLRTENLVNLAKDASFIAIMAIGATFIIVAGQIDLSVGSIYALASVIGALVFHYFGPEGSQAEAATWVGVSCGMLACATTATVCGLVNGSMVVALRVHPFIITLGTMAIYRGIANVITGGESISQFPEAFRLMIRGEEGSQINPVPMVVMLAVAAIAIVWLGFTAIGRKVYAVGGNEDAARLSGVSVTKVKIGVFALAGLTAGVSSLLSLGYYGGAGSADGTGYELDVIAAAVVGGASLNGGRGSALGAMLGAIIIKMLDNGIIILGIDSDYSRIIIGASIILAVVFDQTSTWWRNRRALQNT